MENERNKPNYGLETFILNRQTHIHFYHSQFNWVFKQLIGTDYICDRNTWCIYAVSSSNYSSPSMSLIIISSELVWLSQLKFTQPHTSVQGRLLFRQLNVLLHPRLHPHFTKFITAAGTEDSNILHRSIMMSGRVKPPTTIDRRREAWMAFPGLSPNHCYVVRLLNMQC